MQETFGDQLEKFALHEHEAFYKAKKGEERPFTGVLPCFCRAAAKTSGYEKAMDVEARSSDGKKVKICKEYVEDYY